MARDAKGGSGIAGGGAGGRAGKPGSHRKGAPAGSGGQGRKRLEGRGATPPAEVRTGHPAQRRANAAAKATELAAKKAAKSGRPSVGVGRSAGATTSAAVVRGPRPSAGSGQGGGGATGRAYASRSRGGTRNEGEVVAGRNSVLEALRAKVPATTLLVADGIDHDERVVEALKLADKRGITVQGLTRAELDRATDRAMHQGLGLAVPEYRYAHPDDLLARALEAPGEPLLVALDSVTDPRNLGAVVRSAAAFGAQGVLIPERRAAGMSSSAWKTSAGAAARIPVGQTVNLTRTLLAWAQAGLVVVGLDVDGELSLDDLEVAVDPLVIVVGSEGKGLSRLVARSCDLLVRIPVSAKVESLNAGIAGAVALAEVARRRRQAAG